MQLNLDSFIAFQIASYYFLVMSINEAINRQIEILTLETDKIKEYKNNNSKAINQCFTVLSLNKTLRDMIQARDEGKTEW